MLIWMAVWIAELGYFGETRQGLESHLGMMDLAILGQ